MPARARMPQLVVFLLLCPLAVARLAEPGSPPLIEPGSSATPLTEVDPPPLAEPGVQPTRPNQPASALPDRSFARSRPGPEPSVLRALATPDRYRLRSITIYWDNDGIAQNIFNDTDRYYTSGQGFELGFDFTPPDELLDRLAPGWTDPRFGLGLSLKQHIYTSADITAPNPPEDDHPYAGWLSLGLALQRSDATRHDHLEIDLGIVGPSSFAEDIQNWVHDEFPDQDEPQGWGSQLGDEPAVNVTYQRTWRTEKADLGGLEFDMLPALGFDAGTVFIRARAQATLRLGFALPDDFGPASFLGIKDHTARAPGDAARDWSVYGYLTLGADAVGRNLFLDGDAFEDSRSTDPERLVSRATAGIVAHYKMVEFGWSQTFESRSFKSQPNSHTYGSFVLGLRWVF